MGYKRERVDEEEFAITKEFDYQNMFRLRGSDKATKKVLKLLNRRGTFIVMVTDHSGGNRFYGPFEREDAEKFADKKGTALVLEIHPGK